jgi:YVTN family beta-propeller protein
MLSAGVVRGAISPKSVVATPAGLVFAQNMMYRHTITVYDRARRLVRTIDDTVDLAAYGVGSGRVRGAPVEAAVAPDGRHVYVSNYSMYGPGYGREGSDRCSPASGYDDSVVYRVDVARLRIDRVIPVGSVPKYLTVTPDGRWLLVSNWCSYSVSVVDLRTGREAARVPVGPYPRGLAVDPSSRTAYVAVMGADHVAVLDLRTRKVARTLGGTGRGPRHLVLSADGRTLWATVNGSARVIQLALPTGEVVRRVSTGAAPRTMAIAPDGRALYVVNYESDTVSKVRASDLAVLQTVGTDHHPIGVTVDPGTGDVWVASYAGSIRVFAER